MKIPTLIGVALILALIGSFGFWFLNRKEAVNPVNFEVKDLQVANISDISATIVWQTNSPTTGLAIYGTTEKLDQKADDNRDYKTASPRLTHFVTLKNLKPNTHYFYKVMNNEVSYPEKVLEFQTANIKAADELNFSFIKPLKGTILNTSLNPIDESLVFLEIPGAEELVTFSSTAGNFILPLKLVLNQDLNQVLSIPQNTLATLTVKKGALSSKVKLSISDSTMNLPPITIGSTLDLSNYTQTPINVISIGTPTAKVSLDFNSDGKINSLDLAILRGKAGSSSLLNAQDQAKFDINSNGVVDQEDVDTFSKSLVAR